MGDLKTSEEQADALNFIGVHLVHSHRRQTTGSTRVARIDGTYAAASPAAIRTAIIRTVSSDLSRHSPKLRQTGLRRVLQGANQFFSPALALPFVIIWVSRSGRNLFHPGP